MAENSSLRNTFSTSRLAIMLPAVARRSPASTTPWSQTAATMVVAWGRSRSAGESAAGLTAGPGVRPGSRSGEYEARKSANDEVWRSMKPAGGLTRIRPGPSCSPAYGPGCRRWIEPSKCEPNASLLPRWSAQQYPQQTLLPRQSEIARRGRRRVRPWRTYAPVTGRPSARTTGRTPPRSPRGPRRSRRGSRPRRPRASRAAPGPHRWSQAPPARSRRRAWWSAADRLCRSLPCRYLPLSQRYRHPWQSRPIPPSANRYELATGPSGRRSVLAGQGGDQLGRGTAAVQQLAHVRLRAPQRLKRGDALQRLPAGDVEDNRVPGSGGHRLGVLPQAATAKVGPGVFRRVLNGPVHGR